MGWRSSTKEKDANPFVLRILRRARKNCIFTIGERGGRQRARWLLRQRAAGSISQRPRESGRAAARQGRRRQRATWLLRQRAAGSISRRPREGGRAAARQGRRRQR